MFQLTFDDGGFGEKVKSKFLGTLQGTKMSKVKNFFSKGLSKIGRAYTKIKNKITKNDSEIEIKDFHEELDEYIEKWSKYKIKDNKLIRSEKKEEEFPFIQSCWKFEGCSQCIFGQ